jgi:hypothetical protein
MTPPDKDRAHEEEAAPRGALLFILVYLLIVVLFWINTYLRLWIRG